MTTRREMLVGLGGILATGTCPAVLNNVPLCLVGNLEVDKMETVVCNVEITKSDELLNWITENVTTPNTVLILKSSTVPANGVSVIVTSSSGAPSLYIRFRNGNFQSIANFSTVYDSVVLAGSEFYVFRYNQ